MGESVSMKKPFVITFGALAGLLVIWLAVRSKPTVSVIHENSALTAMSSIMELITKENPTGTVTNWSQLEGRFNFAYFKSLDGIYPDSFPLQKHFVFVQGNLPADRPWKGTIILIRFQSAKNADGRAGRGMISQSTNGFHFSWLPESEVQELLRKANVTLPAPAL